MMAGMEVSLKEVFSDIVGARKMTVVDTRV
jgi:hypothetical protein